MARSIKRVDNLEFRWVESNYHPGYYEIVSWQDYDAQDAMFWIRETVQTYEVPEWKLN